uniref:Uncharacterized protein n=1 Tax=Oryza nivara TaxID=4536 RepID=A0A0E0HAN3_ORYNI
MAKSVDEVAVPLCVAFFLALKRGTWRMVGWGSHRRGAEESEFLDAYHATSSTDLAIFDHCWLSRFFLTLPDHRGQAHPGSNAARIPPKRVRRANAMLPAPSSSPKNHQNVNFFSSPLCSAQGTTAVPTTCLPVYTAGSLGSSASRSSPATSQGRPTSSAVPPHSLARARVDKGQS